MAEKDEVFIRSLHWKNFKKRAEKVAKDPKEMKKIIEQVSAKVESIKPLKGVIEEALKYVLLLIRLVTAYLKGIYKEVPWETIVASVAALLYFLSPLDVIPDPIPVIGLADDVAVIGMVVKSVREDLDNFASWEKQQATTA